VGGSEDQIKQILWNLILNAAQATGEGGMILISTAQWRDSKGLDMVRLTVADSGPGIPENIKEKIFEPFFSTKEDGTGLGLPIVARIVDCLGGKIELDSSIDWKTMITVSLPTSSLTLPAFAGPASVAVI